VPLLSDDEISAAVAGLHWERDGDALVRTIRLADFGGALAFVNEVGRLAEERNHHPDIDIRWNTVTLRLSSHDAGGITDRDTDLAAAIDALA